MSGVLVKYYNTDDIDGSCYCGDRTSYPGLKAINAGLNVKPFPMRHCPSYGVPGVYNQDQDYVCLNIYSNDVMGSDNVINSNPPNIVIDDYKNNDSNELDE